MRVIAGSARSLRLEAPDDKVRPTTDRTKETLFNMISDDIPGALVLDLFGGSGGLGIEALSRGAALAFFSDRYKGSIDCIKKNLQHTKLIEKAKVFMYDYKKMLEYLGNEGVTCDIIFLDPPYNEGLEMDALKIIDQMNLVSEDGIVVVESSLETLIDDSVLQGLSIYKSKVFKTNKFTFIQKEVD